jgi:hypothetical protein
MLAFLTLVLALGSRARAMASRDAPSYQKRNRDLSLH